MFIHTNQPLITSFYIKRYLFCRISDESALIRNFLRNGRVRVKIMKDSEETLKVNLKDEVTISLLNCSLAWGHFAAPKLCMHGVCTVPDL